MCTAGQARARTTVRLLFFIGALKDAGAARVAKRAELFREELEEVLVCPIGEAFADKHRSAGIISGDLFVNDAADATALVVDDLISTGSTLLRAARAARAAGARRSLRW
jgi:phosphoribosylpyrophosphate synthetase